MPRTHLNSTVAIPVPNEPAQRRRTVSRSNLFSCVVSNFRVDLAALDALHAGHYSRRLLIFRCTSPAQRNAQLAALKGGLQALISRCPILAGIVVPPSLGEEGYRNVNWRTIKSSKGLELIMRDLSKTLPAFDRLDIKDFQPRSLPYDLLVSTSRSWQRRAISCMQGAVQYHRRRVYPHLGYCSQRRGSPKQQ